MADALFTPYGNAFIEAKSFFGKKLDDRKRRIIQLEMIKAYERLSRMFKWKLPDTITARYMELITMSRGYGGFIMVDGKLYFVMGGLGGKPNWEYMPSQFIVSNPYLMMSAQTYEIYGEKPNCVIMPNNSLYASMNPLINYHAELLCEINLTKRAVLIKHRDPDVLVAPDNNTYEDMKDYIESLSNGDIKVIMDKNIMGDARSIGATRAHNTITQVLEAEQYQKAALFNDLGLQLNYNMKRETITSSEAQLGEAALLPLPDDMMEMRKLACKQVKDIFDVDINVEFDSAWRNLRVSNQAELKKEESEAEIAENQAEGKNNEVQTFGQAPEEGNEEQKETGSEDGENKEVSDEEQETD